MLSYLASYDIESERCLQGVRRIAEHHKAHRIPATFFIVGELLQNEAWAGELVGYIDDPLFEIGNHTFSHLLLRFGHAVDEAFLLLFAEELQKTNDAIQHYFGKNPIGFRSPMGFPGGLRGETALLNVLWNAGLRYICTQALGKHGTVPAPLADPYYYDEEDILHPILEIPAHGWHDNVLKGYNFCPVAWPPSQVPYPEQAPVIAAEEFSIWKDWITYAESMNAPYFAPVFHPWSVYRFNQEAETIRLLLEYLTDQDIPTKTYGEMYMSIQDRNLV